MSLAEDAIDHLRDKMFCRWCKKRVNISTEKAIVCETKEGYFYIYCERCKMEIEEVNDDDFLNQIFGDKTD